MIGKSFVTSHVLKVEDSQLLGRLFAMRQSGDYDDLFDWEEKDVAPLIPLVEDYIQRISCIINNP